MALHNREPPTHRISQTEERKRILAEALVHAAEHEQRYRTIGSPPPGIPWKWPTAFLLLALSAYLSLLPPGWLAGPTPPTSTQGEMDRGLRAAMWIQAQQIEAYRLRYSGLPLTLADVGPAIPGLIYVRSNNRVYQLVANRPGARRLVYDSARPAAGFAAAIVPVLNAQGRGDAGAPPGITTGARPPGAPPRGGGARSEPGASR